MKNFENNDSEPFTYYKSIPFFSAGKYSHNLKRSIWNIKFQQKKDVSGILAKYLYDYWKNNELFSKQFEVIPIPIHLNKKKSRGYDQTEIIAKKFSFLCNYKYNSKLLIRVKDTIPQYKLNAQERKENLANAFKVNTKFISAFPILLIDDICTTGTTIKEAINTLKNENITDITVLTISNVDLSRESIHIKT